MQCNHNCSCALLFGLKRKGVILCGFKATCSLVNTGLTPLVFAQLSIQMEFDTEKPSQMHSAAPKSTFSAQQLQ